jgi:tripartite-type tricarboxylate transporter receptor subunit TctC
VWVPTGTPAPIVQVLNREIVRVLGEPEIRQKFLSTGVETVGSSPDEFASKIRSETVKWGRIFKAAGIRAQ